MYFPDLDNTYVVIVFTNSFGKAISGLKIVWDIIFKTDIHVHMWEKVINDITNFTLIGNDFVIFIIGGLFTGKLFRGAKSFKVRLCTVDIKGRNIPAA